MWRQLFNADYSHSAVHTTMHTPVGFNTKSWRRKGGRDGTYTSIIQTYIKRTPTFIWVTMQIPYTQREFIIAWSLRESVFHDACPPDPQTHQGQHQQYSEDQRYLWPYEVDYNCCHTVAAMKSQEFLCGEVEEIGAMRDNRGGVEQLLEAICVTNNAVLSITASTIHEDSNYDVTLLHSFECLPWGNKFQV